MNWIRFGIRFGAVATLYGSIRCFSDGNIFAGSLFSVMCLEYAVFIVFAEINKDA